MRDGMNVRDGMNLGSRRAFICYFPACLRLYSRIS